MRHGVVVSVLIALIVWASPMPAGASHAAATVTPSTNLTDGQTVTVSWSGFAPGQAPGGMIIDECVPDWRRNGIGCDQDHGAIAVPAPIPASGSLTYVVHRGTIDKRRGKTCGTTEADNNCVILFGSFGPTTHIRPHYSVEVPISFDPSP